MFSRTYRSSACELNIGLGFGWSHSLSHTLEVNDDVLIWTDAEHKKTTLDKPTKMRPELYNKLAKAAAFLGDQNDEYILFKLINRSIILRFNPMVNIFSPQSQTNMETS